MQSTEKMLKGEWDSTQFSTTTVLSPYGIQTVNKMVISCFIHKNKLSCTILRGKHCT